MDAYRWQDVACCKEHAAQYFAAIAESRNESVETLPEEYKNLLKSEQKSEPEIEFVFTESSSVDTPDEILAEESKPKGKSKKKRYSY